jgi:hypothetical protein
MNEDQMWWVANFTGVTVFDTTIKNLVTQATRHLWNKPFSNTTQFPAVYKFCIPHTIKFLKTSARNFGHHAGTAHCVLTSSVPSTLSAGQRNGKSLVWQTSKPASSWCSNCYTVQVATWEMSSIVTEMHHTPVLSSSIILRKRLISQVYCILTKGFLLEDIRLLRHYTISTLCNIPQGLNPQ